MAGAPRPSEEVTHPENAASGSWPLTPSRLGRSGLPPATPNPPAQLDPRPPSPAPVACHPTSGTSPLGIGSHLAPHSETLPRFEIQVAGDQTLCRQDPPSWVRRTCPLLPAVTWGD
jgi:hypothetical protein